MTYYRPCFNCASDRKTCPTAARIRAGMAGLGITSVSFKCAERRPKFMPGDRVTVTWPVYPEDWRYEDGASMECWPATVASEAGKKFIIKVDDVDSDHDTPAREYVKSQSLYCKVSASKLTPLDEPARTVCLLCGEVGGAGFAGCGAANGDGRFLMGLPPLCERGKIA